MRATGIPAVLVLVLALQSAEASAFCGAYVGGATTNAESIVVVVRQGDRTTLTLANEFGDAEGTFGYVMPVPAGLGLDDVALVDPAIIDRLDAYSAPRVVAYTCEDVSWYWTEGETGGHWEGSAGGGGCGGSSSAPAFHADDSGGSGGATGVDGEGSVQEVTVSERATLGSYELAVVEAGTGDGLGAWLDEQGFAVGDETAERLQVYLDGGADFLVGRVVLEELPEGRSWLDPLRISYTSDLVSLPLWLGAANSAGEQDLLVFGITESDSGAMAIANYPDFSLEDECLVDDVDGYLSSEWRARVESSSEAPWASEFGWPGGKCDPCPDTGTLTDAEVGAVGFDGRATDAFFTRIHLRYTAEQMIEDVVLYESGLTGMWQTRFIDATAAMAEFFPTCDGVEAPDGDRCEPPADPPSEEEEEEEEEDGDEASSGLCCGTNGAALLFAGLSWARRRRHH